MKVNVLVVVSLLLLAACQPASDMPDENAMQDSMSDGPEPGMDLRDHLGCQEGEIIDGACALTDENNVDLFDKLETVGVVAEEVEYLEGVSGFFTRPADEGEYPGVVLIHEWWGLNENIKDMARLLADEGYAVLAVDLYDGEVATESSEAGKLAGAARENAEKSVNNMRAAVSYLRERSNGRIGSLGWCFGGQQSLRLALSGEEMDATAIYYGHLVTDKEELSMISWPVLGVFGAEDSSIPVESVNAFEQALNELGVDNEVYVYPDVGHAFANPSGSRYAPEETKDAWEKTVAFLDGALK